MQLDGGRLSLEQYPCTAQCQRLLLLTSDTAHWSAGPSCYVYHLTLYQVVSEVTT